jgi:hypothetical protein
MRVKLSTVFHELFLVCFVLAFPSFFLLLLVFLGRHNINRTPSDSGEQCYCVKKNQLSALFLSNISPDEQKETSSLMQTYTRFADKQKVLFVLQ